MVVDESHVTLSTHNVWRRQKPKDLVEYGLDYRAMDNPLKFEELRSNTKSSYVSATPADYELQKQKAS
jgi:excinuclease UvrABC helicase subunit UvrB